MAEGKAPAPTFNKGDRAVIKSGRKGVGMRGEIFWTGENKYGPGFRYGLRGDDGITYWVDESEIGNDDGKGPPPEQVAPVGDVMERGDEVEILVGPAKGEIGTIFWAGKSKYGPGMRYGVRVSDDADGLWLDSAQVKRHGAKKEPAAKAKGGAPKAAPARGGDDAGFEEMIDYGPPPASEPPPFDDAPLDDGALPPEAFDQPEEEGPY